MMKNTGCPRCGGSIPNEEFVGQYPGALSRVDNQTEICSACGTDEAFQQMQGSKLSFNDWVREPGADK